jgi:hypothetical protein
VADTLMFVGSDSARCATLADPLNRLGWATATVDPTAADALETIVGQAPVATVFDLTTGPFQAIHELAKALLTDAQIPRPLLVFVGGSAEEVASVKDDVPFGVFVDTDELTWVLKHLIYKD